MTRCSLHISQRAKRREGIVIYPANAARLQGAEAQISGTAAPDGGLAPTDSDRYICGDATSNQDALSRPPIATLCINLVRCRRVYQQ